MLQDDMKIVQWKRLDSNDTPYDPEAAVARQLGQVASSSCLGEEQEQ